MHFFGRLADILWHVLKINFTQNQSHMQNLPSTEFSASQVNKIRALTEEKNIKTGKSLKEKEHALLDGKRKSAAVSSQKTSKARIQEQRAVKISAEQRNTFDTYGIC